jgi:hypothetical protein
MQTQLLAVHPVLFSSDPSASARFFAHLGFSILFQDREHAPRYVGIARDGIELHLQWSDVPAQWTGDRPVYRFLVVDVDALHRAFAASGVFTQDNNGRSPWAQPAHTPWGTREFHLRDPDGNGLQFYQAHAP